MSKLDLGPNCEKCLCSDCLHRPYCVFTEGDTDYNCNCNCLGQVETITRCSDYERIKE